MSYQKHKCPFLCYGCLNLGDQDQVAMLKEEVEELKWQIIQLKMSLSETYITAISTAAKAGKASLCVANLCYGDVRR